MEKTTEKKRYNTRQRSELLEFMRLHSHESFSARQLIRAGGLSMGEATVYRTLSELTKEGVLIRESTDGGAATYRYNQTSGHSGHLHLQCLGCSEVICTDRAVLDRLDSELDFSVDDTKTTIFGLCSHCRREGKQHDR